MAGAGGPVQCYQRAAVDAGQGECGKGARQQRLPADPAKRSTCARGELGIPQAQATWPDDREDQVETGQGGRANGRTAEVSRLVIGESGDRQQREGPGEGGGGELVREPADGQVDEGERDGEQDQPSQCRQFLRVPKISSVQVRGMTPADPRSRGFGAVYGTGRATAKRSSRHDARLCCCDWPA